MKTLDLLLTLSLPSYFEGKRLEKKANNEVKRFGERSFGPYFLGDHTSNEKGKGMTRAVLFSLFFSIGYVGDPKNFISEENSSSVPKYLSQITLTTLAPLPVVLYDQFSKK